VAPDHVPRYYVRMVPKVPLGFHTGTAAEAVFRAEREATDRQIARAREAIRRSLELLAKFEALAGRSKPVVRTPAGERGEGWLAFCCRVELQ
jgi:hypothetical protein